MYGVYYPRPETDHHKGTRVRHDLVLSPIPYRRWPRTARLSLFIRHSPEKISKISQFLAEQGVSIVQSESARAAYRYEVWSFYVVLAEDDQLGIPGPYSADKKVFAGTHRRLREIRRRLEREYRDVLFVDCDDLDLRRPVQTLPNTALAHFYDTAERGKKEKKEEEDLRKYTRPPWVYHDLQFRCTGPGVLKPESNGLFTAILQSEEHATEKTPCERRLLGDKPMKLLPSVAYASLDTRYLSLRLAILPEHIRDQFFELSVSYQRKGPPDHSRGLVAALTGRLPQRYNVWSSVHRTLESTVHSERGQVVMLVEDQGAGRDDIHRRGMHPDDKSCVALAESALMGLAGERRLSRLIDLSWKSDPLNEIDPPAGGGEPGGPPGVGNGADDPLIVLDPPVIKSVTKRRVRRKLDLQRSARGDTQVFISYSQADRQTAERIYEALKGVGLDVYKADHEQESGDDFSDSIRRNLLGCRELWVLCTRSGMKSEWVQTEWGTAWSLEKRIVPVVLDWSDLDLLPMRLRGRQAVLFADIEQAARQAVIRIDTAQLG
jgi:hypothetical protein